MSQLTKIMLAFVGLVLLAIGVAYMTWFGLPLQKNDRHSITETTRIKMDLPQQALTNQFGEAVTEKELENKIYVADFFFTSCPTICPKMANNMVSVQNIFKNNLDVLLVSHTIDNTTDSIPRLNAYGKRYGAIKDKWHLVTANDQDAIYDLAKEYYVTAVQDKNTSGSFVHDGSFILVDAQKNIRGIYDGTDKAATEVLIKDIITLLNE